MSSSSSPAHAAMDRQALLWATPPETEISLTDCSFYTVQEIPGLAEPTAGEWDLRQGTRAYLGNVDFSGKTVLELGPASGYLTFEMERMGASVTSIELLIERDTWDAVPYCGRDWEAEEREHREKNLRRVQNAYWFAHRAFQSKARVAYSRVYDLAPEIGVHDISVLGCVLLHLQNPFLAMQNMLRLTRETAIVTDLVPPRARGSRGSLRKRLRNLLRGSSSSWSQFPFLQFLPGSGPEDTQMFTWWMISPQAVVQMANVLGFGRTRVLRHVQYQDEKPIELFTVVCERTAVIGGEGAGR